MTSNNDSSKSIRTVAVLGAGLIGCSWGALFAASGFQVNLFDSQGGAAKRFQDFWTSVADTLVELGVANSTSAPEVYEFDTAAEAAATAEFVQESIPERLGAKRALYASIEAALPKQAIVATSSSGLRLSDLQTGWQDPSRIIVAHPFNPPHIIPLVELYGNERTAPGVLETARGFYERCGKQTITLKREVIGHVANRLQAALWREAIHLVADDVVSVQDVDTAITAGPGMRWAVMGPHMLLNLGGGPGGLQAYCEQFRDSYKLWWDDLGKPQLDDATIAKLKTGIGKEVGTRDYDALKIERDAKLVALAKAIDAVRS